MEYRDDETDDAVREIAAILASAYPADPSGETAYVLDWHEDGFDFRLFGRDPSRALEVAETLRGQ